MEADVVVSTPDVWRTLIQIEQQAWGFAQDPQSLTNNKEASDSKAGPYSPQFRHLSHRSRSPVSAGCCSLLLCLHCHHGLHLHKTWAFTDITTNFFRFPILTEYQQLSGNPLGLQHPTGTAGTFSLWAGPAPAWPPLLEDPYCIPQANPTNPFLTYISTLFL